MLLGVIAFVFMLSFIVVIHELGHFLVARHFGVYCHEFSIGMGPAIYQKQGKQTLFSIRAIPFGGYVMMAGENDGSQSEEDELSWLRKVPEEQRLYTKPAWQQICIMAAGVCMNVLVAWAMMIGISMAKGYTVAPAKPIVYQVVEDSPAEKAGLLPEDEIIRIEADGESLALDTQTQLLEFVQYHHDEVTLTILRGDQTVEISLSPSLNKEDEIYTIGIISLSSVKEIKWYESFKYGTLDMIDTASSIYRSLGMLIQGKGLENLSGPVGIYSVTAKSASYGLLTYLSLFAMICLNIGIFNLIPIPALDGGRILILIIERLLGRKVNQRVVESIIIGSFVFLFGILIFATFNDILRFFVR